jgi:CRP/FNR family transcriptional regulator
VRNLQCNPEILFGMLEFAALELSVARSQIVLLGSLSAEEKLIEFLIDWRNRLACIGPLSNILPLPMTRSDIAESIGIRLETVCRALAKLEREKIVRVVPKGLQLLGSLQLPLLLQRRCKPD